MWRTARRAYFTPGVHRAVPLPVACRLIDARAERVWRTRPDVRADATRQMRYLLGRSSRSEEVPDLARRYVRVTRLRAELSWRPWLTVGFDGLSTVRSLLMESGLLVSFVHQGRYGRAFDVFRRHRIPVTLPASPHLLAPDAGRDAEHRMAILGRGTTSVVSARGSRALLRDSLLDGGCVGIAHDVFGSCEVTFLGRRVKCAPGIAELAVETGCPILPIFNLPIPGHALTRLQVGDPLRPADFGDPAAMLQALVSAHEPAILAWPEAVDMPLLRGLPADPDDFAAFGYADGNVVSFCA
jgi:lauroyl/myristoyl acyltransferase